MGMPTCYSIPVKAKFMPWWGGAGQPRPQPDWQRHVTMDKECYEEELWEKTCGGDPNKSPVVPAQLDLGSGWSCAWQTRDIKDIYAVVLTKDNGKEIFAINSDQYAPEGEFSVEFFSNDEADLLEFIADLFPGREGEVERDTTIHQWM